MGGWGGGVHAQLWSWVSRGTGSLQVRAGRQDAEGRTGITSGRPKCSGHPEPWWGAGAEGEAPICSHRRKPASHTECILRSGGPRCPVRSLTVPLSPGSGGLWMCPVKPPVMLGLGVSRGSPPLLRPPVKCLLCPRSGAPGAAVLEPPSWVETKSAAPVQQPDS